MTWREGTRTLVPLSPAAAKERYLPPEGGVGGGDDIDLAVWQFVYLVPKSMF